MKIVFMQDGIYAYASGSPLAVGGSERAQWLLSCALAAARWSVTVGVREPMKPRAREVIKGVEYCGIDRGDILKAWYRFLAAQRPDWLYWQGADHMWGPLVEVAKFLKVRTIFSAGCDLDVEPRHAAHRRRRWWPLYAWGLARTDRIFVQHEGQLVRLHPRWQSKAHILPKICILPGVTGDAIAGRPHCERENYVAWVAMLGQFKRPDILIEIARKTPAIRYVVCGGPIVNFMAPPGYGERIVNELRMVSNVEFLGQVAPEKSQQVIANAALLLSTSDVEGFPNTFVQAWASGTPVVSLKIDPDHLIERMGLGAVCGTADRAIAEITSFMNSPHRRDEIAIRAQRLVSQNYSATAAVKSFGDALRHMS